MSEIEIHALRKTQETSKTGILELTFDVGRQDDDGWPWVITLESVSPRGTGMPAGEECRCQIEDGEISSEATDEPSTDTWVPSKIFHFISFDFGPYPARPPSRRLCNACAVELSIENLGVEEWLLGCDPSITTDPMPDNKQFKMPPSSHFILKDEGTLVVRGWMEWWKTSWEYDEYDEMFHVESSSFTKVEEAEPTSPTSGSNQEHAKGHPEVIP